MRPSKVYGLARFATSYLARLERPRSMPLEVSIELTNVCNFRCVFCPQSDPAHHQRVARTYLAVDGAKLLLRQVRKMGYTSPLIHWTLDGEPFMNKECQRIFSLARDLGFTSQLFATNGLLLTQELTSTLPRGISYTFTIDLCGDESLFETHRGGPGSWRKILENIGRILCDPTLAHMNILVTDIAPYAIHDAQELARIRAALIAHLPPSNRLKISSKTFHNATGFLPTPVRKRQRYALCPYPWSSLVIASNGDVVACCRDLEHKVVLGNAFQEALFDIWRGEKFAQLRRLLIAKQPERIAACRSCDMPWDGDKFSIRNILRTLVNRFQFRS